MCSLCRPSGAGYGFSLPRAFSQADCSDPAAGHFETAAALHLLSRIHERIRRGKLRSRRFWEREGDQAENIQDSFGLLL